MAIVPRTFYMSSHFYPHKNLNGVNDGISIYKRRNQTQGIIAYKAQT